MAESHRAADTAKAKSVRKKAKKAPTKGPSKTATPRLDARIAAAIDTMSEGFALFDPKDRMILCNARWRDFTPAPPDLLLAGAQFADMLRAGLACNAYPDAAGREETWLKERLAARNDPTQTIELRLSGGRWVLIEEQPTEDGGIVSVVTEITELKRHEQEAIKQSELLVDALANMAQGLIAFDADLAILASNERAAQILDVSPDMLRPGASFENFIRFVGKRGDYGEGDPEELITRFRQMAKDREPQHFVRQRPDGTWLETRGYPRPGGGYVATYSDISELKRHEQEISAQSELITAAMDNMGQGLISVDQDLSVTAANSRAAEMLDISPDLLRPGADFKAVIRFSAERGDYGPGDVEEHVAATAKRALSRAEIHRERVLPNGTVLEVNGKPLPGGGRVVTYTDVTELKRHEREIAEKSALLSSTFENMAQGLLAFDKDFRVLARNACAIEMLNVPSEMLEPGREFEDTIRFLAKRGDYGPGDPEELAGQFLAVARNRQPGHHERKMPDGRVIEVARDPRPDGGLIVTYTDVTERRQHEREVAWQSELLAATLDNMSQGLLVFDADMTILTSNKRVAELLDVPENLIQQGCAFEKVIGIGAERGDYGPGDVDEIVARYVAKGQEREAQHHQRTLPDGTILQIHAHPRPDGGFVVTYTDVTKERHREQEIEEKSELLAATLETMAQGLVVYDPDLTIVASNLQAAKLVEMPEERVAPGANFGDIVRISAKRGDYGPGDPQELNAKYLELATNMPAPGVTVERNMPSGTVVEVQGLRRPGGGSVMTMTDVTERKRSEERLKDLNEELATNADELKRSNTELEQFAYVASHDLQEPLRMVSSYCQLLQSRYQDVLDEDGNEFIEFAVDGATRMRGLVQDLLAYSRVGSQGKPLEPTDLGTVLDAALLNLSVAIEESATEITRDALPTVMGDETQLVQLLQNLIGNAIKFRGGKPPKIHIGAARKDGNWLLNVRDNGVGIDPEYKDRIFVIFQRLEETMDHEGTGIGLAVCKKIVERHRGSIWVESQPGEGSTFNFTMPAKGVDAWPK